jgi:hypothetical protein
MRIFERLRAARQDPPPIQTNKGAKEAGKAAIPAPILEPEAEGMCCGHCSGGQDKNAVVSH